MIPRILDIIFSFSALLFLMPLMIIITIILRFTGEGEIFYIQKRIGVNGEEFGLYKFATMLKNSPNMGSGEITIEDDPRVLRFGKFLRKSKLNELPQLYNIIIGDMSLVGPRPMVPRTYNYYSAQAKESIDIVRPGLTGIGSIFFRNEEKYLKNNLDPMQFYIEHIIPYKSELEIWFVKNMTLCLYVKVILVTAYVILIPDSQILHRIFKGLPEVPKKLII